MNNRGECIYSKPNINNRNQQQKPINNDEFDLNSENDYAEIRAKSIDQENFDYLKFGKKRESNF